MSNDRGEGLPHLFRKSISDGLRDTQSPGQGLRGGLQSALVAPADCRQAPAAPLACRGRPQPPFPAPGTQGRLWDP